MVVYCMVLLVGLTGNALITTLVYKRKDLRKRTINQLIANMAFSDFVFQLTFIPVELAKAAYGQWPITEPAGSIVCKIQSFVISTSVYVSVQSLTWIALDRFIAVVFPMKVHLISSRFRVLAIASSWIVAVCTCEWKRSEKAASHENVHLRRGSLLFMFYPCHYYFLSVRKGTGKTMFVTQSTKAITWPDDQPFKHGKSNNLFRLCRKLPAWSQKILWFVSY